MGTGALLVRPPRARRHSMTPRHQPSHLPSLIHFTRRVARFLSSPAKVYGDLPKSEVVERFDRMPLAELDRSYGHSSSINYVVRRRLNPQTPYNFPIFFGGNRLPRFTADARARRRPPIRV